MYMELLMLRDTENTSASISMPIALPTGVIEHVLSLERDCMLRVTEDALTSQYADVRVKKKFDVIVRAWARNSLSVTPSPHLNKGRWPYSTRNDAGSLAIPQSQSRQLLRRRGALSVI
jgi:hypothetical protein